MSAATLSQLYHGMALAERPKAPTVLKPMASKEELASLALHADLSMSVASLEEQLSDIRLLLFTIQEHRHDSTRTASLDDSLASLNFQLESAQLEYDSVESRVATVSSGLITAKVNELKESLEGLFKDYDLLRDEFSEDKWLVVFNSVASNAESMMVSLEKVLTACHDFVWSIDTTSSAKDPTKIDKLLASYVSLHKSLHSKRKYYEPSTRRVLDILCKGIADRKTKNGEVLRRFNDMKQRFRNLQERILRVEREMAQLEDVIRETPPKEPKETDTLALPKGLSSGKRATSPYHKLKSSNNRARSDSGSTDASSVPPVPDSKADRRFSLKTVWSSKKETPSFAFHRPTQSEAPPTMRSVSTPNKTLRQAANPPASAESSKPKWNGSRFDPKRDFTNAKPRGSVRGAFDSPSRPLSPAFGLSQSMLGRSATPSSSYYPQSGRASPTASQISTDTSHPGGDSARRRSSRPMSPSRIPKPSSGRPSSPFASEYTGDDSLDDLLGNTSLMQRAMSPSLPDAQEILATPSKLEAASYRNQLFTPEPQMRARASKISRMQRPSSRISNVTVSGKRPSIGGPASRRTPEPSSARPSYSVPPLPGSQGEGQRYVANPYDQLDLEIAAVVNAQPLYIPVRRIDLPLTKLAGLAQKQEDWQAQYAFGPSESKPVLCKLVERTRGGKKQRKVMARKGGGFVDLELLLLDLQAIM